MNGYMLGGSEPFMMIRTRSSGWCWIILEFETGLAESQCHVMCELHYRYNQVEQTDLAINPIPIPPLLRQLQLHMAMRQCVVTPEYQTWLPSITRVRSRGRLARLALFHFLVRSEPQFRAYQSYSKYCSAGQCNADGMCCGGVVFIFLLLASSSSPCYSVHRTRARLRR